MRSDWTEVTLHEVGVLARGKSKHRPRWADHLFGSEYPFIQTGDVRGANKMITSFGQMYSEEGLRQSKLWPQGTLCITIAANIAEVGILGFDACFPDSILGFVPHSDKCISEFVYYLLKTYQKRVQKLAIGSVQDNINLGTFYKISFNLPPLHEQKAIAHILGTLDDKIELNRKMNETLEEMAQALFKSWFVDFDPVLDKALTAGNDVPEPLQVLAEKRKLVPDSKKLIHSNPELAKGFPDRFTFTEELGWIPEGWEVVNFNSLLEYVIGGDWGKPSADEKHSVKAKIIRGTDFPHLEKGAIGDTPTRWVEPKKLAKRALEPGDILIEVSGGSPSQPTGRSVLITENILDRLGGVVEPASFCRLFRPKSRNLGDYGYHHLKHIYKLGKMWGYQVQSTGIANFQTTTFLEVEKLPLPQSFDLLDHFSKMVQSFQKKGNGNQNITLEKLRETLLPKLISGELRVPEALLPKRQAGKTVEDHG